MGEIAGHKNLGMRAVAPGGSHGGAKPPEQPGRIPAFPPRALTVTSHPRAGILDAFGVFLGAKCLISTYGSRSSFQGVVWISLLEALARRRV